MSCQHWISVVWITYLLSGLYKGLQDPYQNVYMNFSLCEVKTWVNYVYFL